MQFGISGLRQWIHEAPAALAKNANARIYIGFDKHVAADAAKNENWSQVNTVSTKQLHRKICSVTAAINPRDKKE